MTHNSMRSVCLGVDPGIANTGIAIVELRPSGYTLKYHATLCTSKKDTEANRYQTDAPVRTDQDTPTVPELSHVYEHHLEPMHSHAEMHQILVDHFGLKCWGCNYIPPDKRYLHLDHIIPKSDGGTNHIDNRALLCQPCNSMKSNTMSLTALRRANDREGYTQDDEPIDIPSALAWTRNYMIDLIRRSPYQSTIDY